MSDLHGPIIRAFAARIVKAVRNVPAHWSEHDRATVQAAARRELGWTLPRDLDPGDLQWLLSLTFQPGHEQLRALRVRQWLQAEAEAQAALTLDPNPTEDDGPERDSHFENPIAGY